MSLERKVKIAAYTAFVAYLFIKAAQDIRTTTTVERDKRKQLLDQMGLDVAAIHNATDIINAQIERGEIRDWDTLQQRVIDEVAFQKMVIREDNN